MAAFAVVGVALAGQESLFLGDRLNHYPSLLKESVALADGGIASTGFKQD